MLFKIQTRYKAVMLDKIDFAIISKLTSDGRISLTALSEGTNLSRVAIANRLEKLASQGFLKVSALVNLGKLNYQTFLVELQIQNSKVQQFKKIVVNFPQVIHSFEVIGPYNFMLVCASKNNLDLKDFVENTLKKFAEDCKVLISSNTEFMPVKGLKHDI